MKNCFLFGHSDAPEEIRKKIEAAVERLYREQDVRLFAMYGTERVIRKNYWNTQDEERKRGSFILKI